MITIINVRGSIIWNAVVRAGEFGKRANMGSNLVKMPTSG